jgi:hypothetical protein
MNLLDLYETREPYQQAIDRLEARRIEDLNAKMDDLIARAREAKTPEHKAGLAREFQKCKDERDGYYKIKEQQVPSKQDPFAYVKPEPKGIGDLQDPKQKMAQLQQKAKKGPLANVGAGLKAFFKGEPEPMDEQDLGADVGPRAYGVANFQRIVKANMGNLPTVTLEFAKPEDNIKLDKKGIDLISDYYDSLEDDSQKNYFIYRVLPSADETSTVLKRIGWQAQVQQSLPGISTQGELPLQEKKKFSNDEPIKSADVKVDRELQKLRAQYPAAGSDLEAVARAEIDGAERSQRQLAAIRGANEKQDALLKQLVSLDQDQGREIDTLDKENDTLEKRLAQVQATNDQLQQAVNTIAGNKKNTDKTNKIDRTDIAQGGIIDVGPTAVATAVPAPSAKVPDSQPAKKQPAKSAVIGNMAQQIQGINQSARQIQGFSGPAPSIRSAANDPQQQVAAESVDHDWDDNEAQDTELRSGDYVRDRQDGESGEIFRMQGDPYERRVRILDRDGKGWYIEPGRLVVVDRNDPDIQRYFGKRRVRDMDEQSVAVKSQDSAIPRKSVIQGYTVFWNPSTKTVSVTRGGDSEEAAIEQARLGVVNLKSFRLAADRLIDRIDNVTEESQDDRNARIIAGEIEDARNEGNEKVAQEKIKKLTQLGYYFDKHGRLQAMGMYETALNPNNPKGDYEAKRRALHDLSLNKDVDQAAVLQRRLDLDREAKAKGVTEGYEYGSKVQHPKYGLGQVVKIYSNGMITVNFPNYPDPVNKKPGVQGNFMPGDSNYQSLKSDMAEGWSDAYVARRTGRPRTPYSVYIKGKKWKDFANDDHARAVMDKLKAKFKADGRDPSVITIAPTDIPEGVTEAEKEPTTRQELLNRVDKIQRMMTQDRNPANLQILRKELEMLKQRYQHLKEDNDSEAVEIAVIKRILVSHLDLIMQFGLDKVTDAIEEVAYNVGDVDEIGTSDVSAYVAQVKQILGATP